MAEALQRAQGVVQGGAAHVAGVDAAGVDVELQAQARPQVGVAAGELRREERRVKKVNLAQICSQMRQGNIMQTHSVI